MTEARTGGIAFFRRLDQAAHSLAAKAVLLIIIFIACPLIIYVELRAADREKTNLLLQSVQEQGRLIALVLRPSLRRFGSSNSPELQKELARIVTGDTRVKLLFRPKTTDGRSGFFYVASSPPVPAVYLDTERKHLIETGLFEKLLDSCQGGRPLALRYANPAGEWEFLSSLTPVRAPNGCWVVLTSYGGDGAGGIALGRPYWQSPEVQLAATIYLTMAVLVLSLFLGVGRSLRRFQRLAKDISVRGPRRASFSGLTRVPELAGLVGEFDRMVDSLAASAKAIRDAAEENAHAFKTPIAVIAQSVEPIRQSLPAQDERAHRALHMVERATDRLDALVGAARHMDEAIADLINPPRERVDLSRLCVGMIEAYQQNTVQARHSFNQVVAPGVFVSASEDMLEVVIENLLDNAVSFASPDTEILMSLRAEGDEAVLVVADRGPGIESGNLERIFERYFSDRSPRHPAAGDPVDGEHFGIGLWVVRRNVEAIGGRVSAANRAKGGLRITIRLPLYPQD